MSWRRYVTNLLVWIGLGALVGIAAGCASALFLELLDRATRFRVENSILVFLLPLAGLAIGAFYERFGAPIKAGSNLVLETIHDPGPRIPTRMAPMVLFGTVLTHLFGGSAGREGTAVQMGATLADGIAHRFGLDRLLRRQILAAGVAGGFGSVFGTPIAGTVFGLEFLVLGRIEYEALVPALVAALVGDMVVHAFGVGHTVYPILPALPLSPLVLGKWVLFSIGMALAATAFIELTYALKKHAELRIRRLPLRMFFGGLSIVLLWQLVGTDDYLGLGIPMIVRAFEDPALPEYAFALKILFTAITLATGYLGGEVTPLFFVGATLGNVLARALDLPLEIGAGVGLAAIFAAASNAPFALSIMAVEILGGNALPHVAIVCVLTYILTGHRGIYAAQRLLRWKSGAPCDAPLTLRDVPGFTRIARAPREPKTEDSEAIDDAPPS